MPTRGRAPRRRPNTPYVTLATVRRAQGVTQEAMAARLGLERKTLGKYETGQLRIPSRLLVRLCAAYGIAVEDIVWALPVDEDADEEPDLATAVGQ